MTPAQRRTRSRSAAVEVSTDSASRASRMARILRMRRPRARGGSISHGPPMCSGIVDFVLCPSQEFVEGANGLESSLIDRLLGQRFQEDAAEFAHDPSLIDLGASSYASTAQNRGRSVAVSRQRVSRANGPRVGPGRRPASVAIRALVVVVGAALTALPRRLPGIGGVAQLTLAQFVQAILLRARQLKIAGTLGCIDVDRIGRIRRRRIGRSRAGPTEKSLQEAHRQRLCHADGRALGRS